jgi:hypothetical protein
LDCRRSVADVTGDRHAVDAEGSEFRGGGIEAVLPYVGDDDGTSASEDLRSGKPHVTGTTGDDAYLAHSLLFH